MMYKKCKQNGAKVTVQLKIASIVHTFFKVVHTGDHYGGYTVHISHRHAGQGHTILLTNLY